MTQNWEIMKLMLIHGHWKPFARTNWRPEQQQFNARKR